MGKFADSIRDASKQKQEQKTEPHDGKKEAEAAAAGEEPEKRLNVRLPESLHDRFKAKCEAEGRSMSWVVKQAIEDYVSTGE